MSNCRRLKNYSNKYTYLNSKTCITDLYFIASNCISIVCTRKKELIKGCILSKADPRRRLDGISVGALLCALRVCTL
jgi:hypothetical protein